MNKKSLSSCAIGAALAMVATGSMAGTLTYDFSDSFAGSPPGAVPPWLEASFTDKGMPANTVQLTLSAVNLSSSEFVSCWYFNLNPSLDASALNISSSSSIGSFGAPSVQTGTDTFKAAGSGKYDILFTFGGAGDSSAGFGADDSVTFTITGIPGLNASDFGFLSTSGDNGPYASAAHIVSGQQNGWVDPASVIHASILTSVSDVPDTAGTLALLSLSALALGTFGWSRRAKAQ
jgi:hypothetical protein